MKKYLIMTLAALTLSATAGAQAYKNSRYYNERTGHLDYSQRHNDSFFGQSANYYGLRIGPSFSTVNSDDDNLDGGKSQTGLNVGAVVGFSLSPQAPLYLETGLFYNEKGGKKNLSNGKKMTYDLNYLEMPVVVKYAIEMEGSAYSRLPADTLHAEWAARYATTVTALPRARSQVSTSNVLTQVCASDAA